MRGRGSREETGQATVEYALVLAAFLALVAGLASVWHLAADGGTARLAEAAASHGRGASTVGAVQDALLY